VNASFWPKQCGLGFFDIAFIVSSSSKKARLVEAGSWNELAVDANAYTP
jgi:hypothetical protein